MIIVCVCVCVCVIVQAEGQTVVGGLLSIDDMTLPYHTDATTTYKPYIVHPHITRETTNRVMRHRLVK